MGEVREILTWERFGEAARELAQQIVDSGYEPDVMLSITRGGLLPAGAIAYALDQKNIHIINVEFYTGVGATLPDPVVLPPALDASELRGLRALVVDDVADSGRTLAMVVTLLEGMGAEVRTAVLYTKPGTVHEPAYTWRRTAQWITFPWSAEPPVTLEA